MLTAKRAARLALLTALALLAFLLEGLFPPLIPALPYVKLGLSNVFVLLCLLARGPGEAAVLVAAKCLLGSLFSGVFSLAFSLPAGLLSLAVMTLLFRLLFPRCSACGLSMAGAAVHNLTQLGVYAVMAGSADIFALTPAVLLVSLPAGLLVGLIVFFCGKILLPRIWSEGRS